MNKLITIAFVLLSIIIGTSQQLSKAKNLNKKKVILNAFEELTVNHKDYTLIVSVEKTNNQHNLIVDIKLHNGSSFISPFEKKEFTGKFYMDLGSDKDLSFGKNIIETPQAVAICDGFKNEPVIWVKKNTTYKQPLLLKTQEKFVAFGRIQFTIEPRCTFEEIPFALSYTNGVFTFIDPKC